MQTATVVFLLSLLEVGLQWCVWGGGKYQPYCSVDVDLALYISRKCIRYAANEWEVMKSVQWNLDREVGERLLIG
jgi:hypothetical protein